MTSTPTPAQRVALEAVRDGRVERYFPLRLGYRKTADPRWVAANHGVLKPRQDTLDRCAKAGWVSVHGSRDLRMRVPAALTDAGREALACHS